MATTLFHWTLHPWAMYAVMGLAVAYGTYRRGRPQLISAAFWPLLGKTRARGPAGKAIDIMAIFATLFGSAASLGLGALQVGAGFQANGWLSSPGKDLLVTIIFVLTVAFVVSAVSGVAKGIQWLSNTNMVLALVLAAFVFVVGPTVLILNLIPTAVGDYFRDMATMSARTAAAGGDATSSWLSTWTIFYWAWWISWTPFVGMFIARISRSRTIRQFVAGVIAVPSVVSLMWFAIFGGAAISAQRGGTDIAGRGAVEAQLFGLLDTFPLTAATSVLVMVLVAIFFVSGADAASGPRDSSGACVRRPRERPRSRRARTGHPVAVAGGLSRPLGVGCGEETLDAVLEASLDSVIGFNVGGIEVDRDPFAAAFDRARAAGLHSVPHAGETHGPDRIWPAIHRLGAERIGHGIRCLDDPALVEYLRSTQLPLDVCPTSNRRTGAIPQDRPHPPRHARRRIVTATTERQPTAAPRLARSAFAVAGMTGAVLVALSGGYGYHRDELYFLVAGAHPAWGYPDQPPLTPLLARATTLFGDSLVSLRLPSTLAIAAVVVLAALLAREFGARPGAQVLAAGCTAVSAFVIAVGHLLSTATFDLLAWTALSWLLARALRCGGPVWLAAGLVAGIGLENKTLLACYLAALAVSLLAVGPRAALRSPWLWVGMAVALAVWAPNLWWQATHGWPLRELSASIAAGGSATSAPRWLFLPYQLVLVGLALVPVWGIGLWRLLRDPQLRTFRLFGVSYLLLAVLFLVTGGKPYYVAGLYPVLLAAGAQPVLDWARRGTTALRTGLLAAALAATAAFSVVGWLPVVPPSALASTPIPEINSDAGATLGWPELVASVAGVHRDLPPGERDRAVILTANYGEAGALEQAQSQLGLPPVFSGHMGFGEWGPPPDGATPTIAVGLDRAALDELFSSVTPAAQIDNGIGLHTAEQGRTVWVCRDQRKPWSQVWSQIRHIG